MTITEQVLECAKTLGYLPILTKRFFDIDIQLKNNEINVSKAKNFEDEYKEPGEWHIFNPHKNYLIVVTDQQLKEWQRDFKLKQILE